MSKVFIKRRLTFSSAHQLLSQELSEAENLKVFGKCYMTHGHNYTLEVTLCGPIDPKTGMVFNLSDLKAILAETVEARFDHKNLNLHVAEFKTLNPTAENIAVVIWNMLDKRLPKGLLHEIHLIESDNNSVIYRGPG